MKKLKLSHFKTGWVDGPSINDPISFDSNSYYDVIELDFTNVSTADQLENKTIILDKTPTPIHDTYGTIGIRGTIINREYQYHLDKSIVINDLHGKYAGYNINISDMKTVMKVLPYKFYEPQSTTELYHNPDSGAAINYLLSMAVISDSDMMRFAEPSIPAFSYGYYDYRGGGVYAGDSYRGYGYTYFVRYKTPIISERKIYYNDESYRGTISWKHDYVYSWTLIRSKERLESEKAYNLKTSGFISELEDNEILIYNNFTDGRIGYNYKHVDGDEFILTGRFGASYNITLNNMDISAKPGLYGYKIVDNDIVDDDDFVCPSNVQMLRYIVDKIMSSIYVEVESDMLDALQTGFVRLYKMDATSLRGLSKRVYSSNFLESLKNGLKDLVGSPIDYILGLNIMPGVPTTTTIEEIKMAWISTGTSGFPLTEQKGTISFGTQRVPSLYGNYLDYEPFVSIQLYLPYIGMVSLPVNDTMGGDIGITYTIDYLSGGCTAYVTNNTTTKVIGEYNGMCAVQIPYGGTDLKDMMVGIINTASSTIASVASAGVSTAEAGVAAGTRTASVAAARETATHTRMSMNAINNSISIPSATVRQNQGVSLGPSSYTASQRPRLYVSRVKTASGDYNAQIGRPTGEIVKLSEVSGFNSFSQVHVNIAHATSTEKSMIESALSAGVVL